MEDMEDEFERARDYTIISRVEARKIMELDDTYL